MLLCQLQRPDKVTLLLLNETDQDKTTSKNNEQTNDTVQAKTKGVFGWRTAAVVVTV